MPRKKGELTYGTKLIKLFTSFLFTGRAYSLTELAKMLDCSKQTVLRLVGEIQNVYGADIEEYLEENKRFFRMKRPDRRPAVSLTNEEMAVLQMCRVFTEHLLGKELFQEATKALEKSSVLLNRDHIPSADYFGSFRPGSIDYTPHHETIRNIIEALDKRHVCKITYRRITADKAKSYYAKPLKMFSHKETIYLHIRMAKQPGKKYREPDYDPLLAVHRIEKIELTDKTFEFPKDYDFDVVFNQHFGIIKDDAFKVVAEFTGYAAAYVAERVWSPDQKIVKKRDGTVRLSFTAASEPEVISWIRSFGEEAKLLKPKWLLN